METLKICLCCLLPADKDLKTPYSRRGEQVYADMLEECFQIHLTLGGECGICEVCVGRLREASDFKLQVQRSQAELQRLQGALDVKDEELVDEPEIPCEDDVDVSQRDPLAKSEIDDEKINENLKTGSVAPDPAPISSCDHLNTRRFLIDHDYAKTGDHSVQGETVELPVCMCDGHGQNLPIVPVPSSRHVSAREQLAAACSVRLERLRGEARASQACLAASRLGARRASLNALPHDTTGKLYKCDTCGEQFTDKSRLIKHTQTHATRADKLVIAYVCGCTRRFSSKSAYFKHKLECKKRAPESVAKRKPYSGEIRRTRMYARNCGLKHDGSGPRRASLKDLPDDTVGKVYKCDTCGEQFTDKSRLIKHTQTHATRADKLVIAYVCGCTRRFSSKSAYFKHKLECKKRAPESVAKRKPYSGEIRRTRMYARNCGLKHDGSGPRRASLKDLPDDTVGKVYKCDTCGEQFTDKSRLIKHTQTHATRADKLVIAYVCGCTRRFSSKTAYFKHKLECKPVPESVAKMKPYIGEIRRRMYARNCGLKHDGSGPRSASLKDLPDDTVGKVYKCDTCGEQFTDKSRLIKHTQTHATRADKLLIAYVCECTRRFSSKMAYFKHKLECKKRAPESVAEKKPYSGEIRKRKYARDCGLKHDCSGPKRASLKDLPDDTVEKLYKCDTCGEQFTDKSRLIKHTQRHATRADKLVIAYVCGCTRRFSSKTAYFKHKLECKPVPESVAKMKPYIGEIRRRMYARNCGMKHDGSGPRSASPKDLPDDTVGKVYKCDTCGEQFTDKSRLIKHTQTHATRADKLVIAYVCGCTRRFSSRMAYFKHKLECRKPASKSVAKKKPYSGEIRRRMYARNCGLKHDGSIEPKIFICDICGTQLASIYSLTSHIKVIHNHARKLYRCEVCYKRFTYISFLNHKNAHIERPHNCEECNRSFKSKPNLRLHKLIHTGEKPYVCDECGKQFRQRTVLDMHKRIHSGIKPYCCEVCNKRFTLKCQLIRHRIIHTGEKPYSCEVCNLKFGFQSSFIKHNKRKHRKP